MNKLQTHFHTTFIFSINLVRMSWNIGENRKLFLRIKTKLGLYHVVVTTPKSSPTKITLTIVELQQLPELEQCEDEISCLKWTIYNGRRKICVGFQTDTDKVDIVVYRYRNNTYLKDTEIELKLAEYKTLLAKRRNLLGTWIHFISDASFWMNPQFMIELFLTRNGRTVSSQRILLLLWIETSLYKEYCT